MLSSFYSKNNNIIKMKKWHKVALRHSIEMAAMHQKTGIKISELVKMYPQYSPRSVYRHAKAPLGEEEAPVRDRRRFNTGRPSKLTIRDKRNLLRSIKHLRATEGWFTAKRLAVEAGIENKVTPRTIRKFLNKNKYRYLQTRKKGLLNLRDLTKRVQWAKKVKRRKLGLHFWTEGIAMYIDGKGFAWKRNPQDQARAPRGRAWRKPNEGLDYLCTGKAGKAGVTNLNFIVGISYRKGVVLCERYYGAITGVKFADIVLQHFPRALDNSIDPRGRRILQDNCPRQNSAVARKAIYSNEVNSKIFGIPARSPDCNPIENFFNLVTRKLHQDAKEMNITVESKDQFEERIKRTMHNFNKTIIDNLLESMPRRVDAIIKGKGIRLRY